MSLSIFDYPLVTLVVCLILFFGASYAGRRLRGGREFDDAAKGESDLVLNGTLTLLALLIGFSFSMAAARFEQRKTDEAREANAIGTAYDQAGLLAAADTATVRDWLKRYLDERVAWYTTPSYPVASQLRKRQFVIEERMWATVERSAKAHQTSIEALVASRISEVVDNAGDVDAAYLNRVPLPAWALMLIIGLFASALIGYSAPPVASMFRGFVVLPFMFAIAFFLIADLDATRDGFIKVHPENLLQLRQQIEPALSPSSLREP